MTTETTPAIPPETPITDAAGETCPVSRYSGRFFMGSCGRLVTVAFPAWSWGVYGDRFDACRLCNLHAAHERRKRQNAVTRFRQYLVSTERHTEQAAQRRAQERLYAILRARLGLGDDADVVAMVAALEATNGTP